MAVDVVFVVFVVVIFGECLRDWEDSWFSKPFLKNVSGFGICCWQPPGLRSNDFT